MLKNILNILRDKFLTVRDKKIAKSKKFLKSPHSEHFYVLVVKGLNILVHVSIYMMRTING